MYLKLDNGKVCVVIPEINPAFPDVPITSRYPASYLAGLMHVKEDTVVSLGWTFNGSTFEPAAEPEPEPELENPAFEEGEAAYVEGVNSL